MGSNAGPSQPEQAKNSAGPGFGWKVKSMEPGLRFATGFWQEKLIYQVRVFSNASQLPQPGQSPRPQAWVHTVYELLSLLSLRMAHAYR